MGWLVCTNRHCGFFYIVGWTPQRKWLQLASRGVSTSKSMELASTSQCIYTCIPYGVFVYMYIRRKRRCGVYGMYECYIVGFFWSPHNVWHTQTPQRSFGKWVCLFVFSNAIISQVGSLDWHYPDWYWYVLTEKRRKKFFTKTLSVKCIIIVMLYSIQHLVYKLLHQILRK